MNKICSFAGHSEIYDSDIIYQQLVSALDKLIEKEHIKEFWVGNYGSFDKLSAKAVREIKSKYPEIKLNLIIPYLTSEINEYRELYYKNYDNILIADIPEKTPKKVQIIKCNQYMVKNSQYMICYVKYFRGGAAKTLEYANKKNINIINLADK